MRWNLALALSVSVLLIGTASWSRLTAKETAQPGLIALEQLGISDEEILFDFLEPADSTGAGSPAKPLTNTDIIGRQLVMDYIELSASGQATEASLAALANKYVESIPALAKAASINQADVKTAPDTKANFQNYADQLVKIHENYAARVGKASVEEESLTSLNPALYSFASSFSAAYKDAATKLQSLLVPTSLASSHLQLVNRYLSSAAAMEAVSKTQEDSAAAFAGLIILNGNIKKEDSIRSEISRILTSNGI